jgi:hypothetical protein
MESYSNKSIIHSRMKTFVNWIAPEKSTRDVIKKQSDEIRNRIKTKAEEDGLTIISMPYSGSFAKKTGLRRHYSGDVETEGQDIDIPFVVKKSEDIDFEPLIKRFEGYVESSYPTTERKATKSSVKLSFSGTKLSYDIVPMFGDSESDKQILIRENGDVIETSIQKHTEFIKSRTKESNTEDGIVSFNECLRLLKWWRERKIKKSSGIIDEIPSFLLDLLAAKAYDKCGVDTTYPQTMANWFNYLAYIVKNRETIWFSDYYNNPKPDIDKPWNVLDPVMPNNNVVKKWQGYQIDEFAVWLQESSDFMNRAIGADMVNEDIRSLDNLKLIFGKIFESHCN